MKKSILIMLLLFALSLFAFTIYILVSGNRVFVPYVQLCISGIFFLLGINEFRAKRRKIATLFIMGGLLCLFAGMLGFMIKA